MILLRSSFLLLAGALVAGCGGDSFSGDPPDTAGGSGGASGSGGSTGGSSGNAGGSAGKSAGGAGTSSGGAGNSAGGQGGAQTGGTAGKGGSSGGASAGQAGSNPAGQGGAGGLAGQGGAAGEGGASGGGGSSVCTPDSFSCFGDLLRKCSADGQWVKLDACGTGLCDEKQGKCRLCKAGEVKSCTTGSTKNQDICTLDGGGYESTPCAVEKPFCVEGACVDCLVAADCPVPSNSCLIAACDQHACGTSPVAEGMKLPDAQQISQDCKNLVCDGKGASRADPDALDLPPDPADADCVLPACNDGTPTTTPAPVGKRCAYGGEPSKGYCLASTICAECIPGTKACFGNALDTCPDGNEVYAACDSTTPVCNQDACVAVSHLAAGARHTCSLLSNGHVVCWGDNNASQLGIPNLFNSPKHIEVTGLTDAVAIAAAEDNTCAIRSNGKVVCWGDNLLGQLGGGDKIPGVSATPVEVIGVDQATSLAVGYQFACAVAGPNKEVFCWGSNNFLQLGATVGPKKSTATKIKGNISNVKQVVSGHDHSCALLEDKSVYCWGINNLLQLGANNGLLPSVPIQIDGLLASSIGAGANHSCSFYNSVVTCWGANGSGQLGTEKTTQNEFPVASKGFGFLDNAVIAGGAAFTCVLDVGKVKCTGSNSSFQLGGGTAFEAVAMVNKPIDVVGTSGGSVTPITGVAEIVAGKEHACVLKTSGQVLCWGANTAAQTGSNPASPKVSFAQLVDWSI